MEKMKMQTGDIANENFLKLAALFPNAVTETIDENGEVVRAIDKDILMQEISTCVVDGQEERYQFTWPDKRQAVRLASSPISATLRPCREESVNFDTTENLYIEGDNLDVLKLLRETYLGKVKMIYIDPPYNTGNDFVYDDDFAENAGEFQFRDNQYDDQGNRLVQNTESNGRFHTDWLNMIYPRLKVAKDLLTEDGVIFISIDDKEIDNLKKICNEIFGEDNLLPFFIRRAKIGGGSDNKQIAKEADFVVVCAKNIGTINTFSVAHSEKDLRRYSQQDEIGRYFWDTYSRSGLLVGDTESDNLYYEVTFPDGSTKSDRWRRSKERLQKDLLDNEAKFVQTVNGWNIHFKQRLNAEGKRPRQIIYDDMGNTSGKEIIRELGLDKIFDYPKPVALSFYLAEIIGTQDAIILDFFSGSATTAHAIMKLNAKDGGKRKFIMVQLPEVCEVGSEAVKAGYKNICEIGKERIRRAGKKIQEEVGLTAANLDIGFRVLKLDSSNMEDVYYSPDKTRQDDLLSLISNIKPDRSPEDLLFQVMLELGVTLSSKIEECEISGKKVFKVAGNFLIACFDENVTDEVVKAIAKEQPTYAVLRDSSFANDSVAANFEQIFATYSPDTVRRVL